MTDRETLKAEEGMRPSNRNPVGPPKISSTDDNQTQESAPAPSTVNVDKLDAIMDFVRDTKGEVASLHEQVNGLSSSFQSTNRLVLLLAVTVMLAGGIVIWHDKLIRGMENG